MDSAVHERIGTAWCQPGSAGFCGYGNFCVIASNGQFPGNILQNLRASPTGNEWFSRKAMRKTSLTIPSVLLRLDLSPGPPALTGNSQRGIYLLSFCRLAPLSC